MAGPLPQDHSSRNIYIEEAPYNEHLIRSVLLRAAQIGMVFVIWVIFDQVMTVLGHIDGLSSTTQSKMVKIKFLKIGCLIDSQTLCLMSCVWQLYEN
jgi:hypothetical protein